jgi:uncharacterized protein
MMMSTTTGIFEAIAAGDLERVKELVANDPASARARDQQGLSAVIQARYHGREEIVAALLRAGPELDVFDAAAIGGVDRVRELLEREPELVSAFSADGFTPLHLAAFFGHLDVAQLLVERGADIEAVARNPMQVMPLHSAAAGRHLEIARLLVGRGADVNAAQERGFTPLHAAAQNGDMGLLRLLLDRGAEPEQAAADGRKAADFAVENGHQEVLTLLGGREVG